MFYSKATSSMDNVFYLYPSSAVPPPPKFPDPIIAAVGEYILLSCPLQFAPDLDRFYTVDWRHPNDTLIVQTGEMPQVQWASLNNETLALTVGPYNSSLPSLFECVSLSFGRQSMAQLRISQSTKGIVQVIIPSKCLMYMHAFMCACVPHSLAERSLPIELYIKLFMLHVAPYYV